MGRTGLAILAAAVTIVACERGATNEPKAPRASDRAQAIWDPPVIPRVRLVESAAEGHAQIGPGSTCHADATVAGSARAALEDLCRVIVGSRSPTATVGASASANIVLSLAGADAALGDEGYALDVTPERIAVRARTAAGLFYGGQTLRQLVGFGPEGRPVVILAARITDVPEFPWRGVHLDVARHFFPVATIERLIDLAALHKLNVLHLHLTDDQGWRFPVPRWPALTRVGGAGGHYTRAELAHLVDHARARFVTIVPEIDMPGHMGAALAAYPELRCARQDAPVPRVETTWGVFDHVLCPDAPGLAFAKDVLDALAETFPGPLLHIGGDEVPLGPWRASGRVKAELARTGLADERALLGKFVASLGAHVVSKGRRPVGWDESLDVGAHPRAAIMAWRDLDAAGRAARAGHDVILTPNAQTYFNFYEGEARFEPRADGPVLPVGDVYALDPSSVRLSSAGKGRVLGVQGCLWTEYVATQDDADRQLFPRLLALAEIAWTPRARRDEASFRARLRAHLPRLDALGVRYRVPSVSGLEADHVVDADAVDVHLDALFGPRSIHVTLDGTDPTPRSRAYDGSLRVDLGDAPVVISARSVSPSGRVSPPRRATVKRARFRPPTAMPGDLAAGLRLDYLEGKFERARDVRTAAKGATSQSRIIGAVSLPDGARAEDFGALYTGFLCVPTDAVWALGLTSDDGAVLSIAGETLIDLDGHHAARTVTARIALGRGCHALSLDYFQAGGERSLDLKIASEAGAKPVIGHGAPTRTQTAPEPVAQDWLRHRGAAR